MRWSAPNRLVTSAASASSTWGRSSTRNRIGCPISASRFDPPPTLAARGYCRGRHRSWQSSTRIVDTWPARDTPPRPPEVVALAERMRPDGGSSTSSGRSGEQLPLTGNPAKPNRAERAEREVGACDEVSNGSRDDDLATAGQGKGPSRDVDADPSDVVAAELDLTGVDRR